MLQKLKNILIFDKKRINNLITPCCNKANKDGKFVTYKNYPNNYGYCHSCGTSSLPPSVYKDNKGNNYYWNELLKKFEPAVLHLSHKIVLQTCNTSVTQNNKKIQYINFEVVRKTCNNIKENNLLLYLRHIYNKTEVDGAKKMYYIGTNKDNGCVFWYINKVGKSQKAKVAYYTQNGKRNNYFKVPYKNEDGYYSCLFGEHLLNNNLKPIVLVESEKTAIVSSILLPNYTWLAYSGINGLTENKLKVLSGHSVIIVPDMSSNAVSIINKKKPLFIKNKVSISIWDMTNGKTDNQLKQEGLYNCDLEDVFRSMAHSF